MQETRKHILDRFQEHLHHNFETYCAPHGIDKTDDLLLTFLIDQDLISAAHIQRYAVLHEFEKLSAEQDYPKTQAVNTLAHRFNISERTVWNILKHFANPKKPASLREDLDV